MVLPVKKEEIDPAVAELKADGTLTLTLYSEQPNEYIGEAILKVKVQLECSRCLKKITHPVESAFSLVLKAGPKPEKSDDDDDENIVFFDSKEEEVDLTGLIEGEIGVNSPMQPLCKEKCKGLCPSCGADLNKAACECKTEPVHPAWEALKKLKGV